MTKAINEMSVPADAPALQRFLGMVNYLGMFIQSADSSTAGAHTQGLWMNLAWTAAKCFWSTKEAYVLPTSLVLLWCQQACDTNLWYFSVWTWCSMFAGRQAYSLCFTHTNWYRNHVCPNWERTVRGDFCMIKVLWLHLWNVGDHWNGPPASSHHTKKAYPCSTSKTAMNDVKTSKVQHHSCVV